MDGRTKSKLPMIIEEHIRAAHAEYGWRLFWPSQFVRAKLGTNDEVVSALAKLVRDDKLDVRAEVRCGGSPTHTIWEGDPIEITGGRSPVECGECEQPGDYGDGGIFLKFYMTDSFADLLDEGPVMAQKKSLALAV